MRSKSRRRSRRYRAPSFVLTGGGRGLLSGAPQNPLMACPLCGDDCRCSHAQLPVFSAAQSNEDVVLPAALRGTGFTAKTFSSHDQSPISVLIDPETKDSEQQFAAGVGIENKADLGSLPESGFSTPLPDFYAANSAIWREEVASRVQNYRT